MTKDQVAAALLEIGTLLELRGENRFKVNAYLNGARTVEQMDEDLAALCQEGRLGEVRGVGATLCEVITTLVTTGAHPLLDTLRAETPIGLMQMLRLPCGSLRRRRETIGDIDLLAAAADPGPIMDTFAALPRVKQVVNRGETLCSVMVAVGDRHGSVLRSDLRVVTDEQFPFALHYFT